MGEARLPLTHPRESPVSKLDPHGGCSEVTIAGARSTVFHLGRLGHRIVLVTPEGHAFWMLAAYSVDLSDGGLAYETAVHEKYGNSAVWARQSVRRLRSWGFNVIGEYSRGGESSVLPLSTYNNPPNSEKMPFIRFIRPAAWCAVKNLYKGTDPSVSATGRSFPDVFDPDWVPCVNKIGEIGASEFTPALSRTESWMIGTTMIHR